MCELYSPSDALFVALQADESVQVDQKLLQKQDCWADTGKPLVRIPEVLQQVSKDWTIASWWCK
ncbi:hypothetical protein [Nostoc sp.]|uniref:hypothetical protein n=1 Tax=Nostoc sp. TaxID=1180 RepID=UPI002FF80CF2